MILPDGSFIRADFKPWKEMPYRRRGADKNAAAAPARTGLNYTFLDTICIRENAAEGRDTYRAKGRLFFTGG